MKRRRAGRRVEERETLRKPEKKRERSLREGGTPFPQLSRRTVFPCH